MEDWWHLLGDHLSVHLKVLPDQLSHESMLASRLLIVTCTWTLALGITVLDTSDAAAQSNQPSAARRRLTPRLSPRLTPAPAAPTPAAPPPAAPTPTPTPAPAPAAPAPVEPPADEGTNSGSFEPAAPAPAPPQTTSIPPVGTSGAPTLPFRPPVLPVFDGAPAPEGYVEESSFNGALLWGGGLTLLVTYGGSLVYGAARNFEDPGRLLGRGRHARSRAGGCILRNVSTRRGRCGEARCDPRGLWYRPNGGGDCDDSRPS